MRLLKNITLLLLTTLFSSCSWLSCFYIINKTSDKIIITYSLNPTNTNDYEYALKDTLEFNILSTDESSNPNKNTVDDDDLIGKSFNQQYSKQIINGKEIYSVTLKPKTAICGGRQLPNFAFSQTDKRHRIFNNLNQMTIIRLDTKDTIILKPTLLSDFSRAFGSNDIALIFD